MKKLLILSLIIISGLEAQENVTLFIMFNKAVPPRITDWERDPAIITLSVKNNNTETGYPDSYFFVQIKDQNGKAIAFTNNNDPQVLKFNITPNYDNTFFGNQIFKFNTVTIDQSIKSKVVTTGLLPEGSYEFCVELIAEDGSSLSGEVCKQFEILIPDPPTLIFPQDGDVIDNFPQFSWTPVTSISSDATQIRYRFKVTPIFEGQSGRNAIERNMFLINDSVNFSTTYQFLPKNPPFEFYPDAVGFAWQVQAVDQQGIPIARNDGKSEIFIFYLNYILDPNDINDIASQMISNINKLKIRFEDNEKIKKILSELERNSSNIINSLRNPSPDYTESLTGNSNVLSKAVTSSDSLVIENIIEINNDMKAKQITIENLEGSEEAFQEIEFHLIIYEPDGQTTVKDAYHVRAVPWALRRNKRFIKKFNNINVSPDAKIELVAGVYDLWVVPIFNDQKRFPQKNTEKEITYPMKYPVQVNVK